MNPHWDSPPENVSLPPGEIHLWRANIPATFPGLKKEDLTPEEWAEAEKMAPTIRPRYSVARWLTRSVLARTLNSTPSEITFDITAGGKPVLKMPAWAGSTLAFNRSHSGDWCIVAVIAEGQVGVDIESIRRREHRDGVIARWFLPEEKARWTQIASLSEQEKSAWFYERWTEKEAVLKCRGCGLIRIADFEQHRRGLHLFPFVPALGYAGCIASTHPGFLRFYESRFSENAST